ncbi:TIR domain-containing protein [Candidatus Eisenbacteria bacterium]|uniref:TIR domain-containing protein n=1 Tax=Eiseniibacteriota bacterium TaxID=2212470 RepID=A0ABV6YI77_UNCEI
MDKSRLFTELQHVAENLNYPGWDNLDALRRRGDMIIKKVFGEDSDYRQALKEIRFSLPFGPVSGNADREAWQSGKAQLLNLIGTMHEDITLGSRLEIEATSRPERNGGSRDVFVVHGHDEAMKEAAARLLARLSLHPVILHEQPNRGRTIIEKFSDHSDNAGFAVVLLSPDDLAHSRSESPDRVHFRARQNVILELGYFLGKLGRSRVVVLCRQTEGFEMPSDYTGVLFVPFDDEDRWQLELAREIKASGYNVDLNALIDG